MSEVYSVFYFPKDDTVVSVPSSFVTTLKATDQPNRAREYAVYFDKSNKCVKPGTGTAYMGFVLQVFAGADAKTEATNMVTSAPLKSRALTIGRRLHGNDDDVAKALKAGKSIFQILKEPAPSEVATGANESSGSANAENATGGISNHLPAIDATVLEKYVIEKASAALKRKLDDEIPAMLIDEIAALRAEFHKALEDQSAVIADLKRQLDEKERDIHAQDGSKSAEPFDFTKPFSEEEVFEEFMKRCENGAVRTWEKAVRLFMKDVFSREHLAGCSVSGDPSGTGRPALPEAGVKVARGFVVHFCNTKKLPVPQKSKVTKTMGSVLQTVRATDNKRQRTEESGKPENGEDEYDDVMT